MCDDRLVGVIAVCLAPYGYLFLEALAVWRNLLLWVFLKSLSRNSG